MKTMIAVILVTLGIVVLAYSGLTFTTPGQPVDFLGIHIETTQSHFIPPVVGALGAFVAYKIAQLRDPRNMLPESAADDAEAPTGQQPVLVG